MNNRIRELRKQNGLTMKKLGKELGLAESTISQYETGRREPDLKTLTDLSDFFGVSVDYLLCKDDTVSDYVKIGEAKSSVLLYLQTNPNMPSGKRIDLLFHTTNFDPMVVCFNLGIDQGYLDSWIERDELPPRPIVDKILSVFQLQASEILAEIDLIIYENEADEWQYTNPYSHELIYLLLTAFDKLNDEGQQKAVERVEELTEIPKYKKEPPQD